MSLSDQPLLRLENVCSGYGRVQVLRDVSLQVGDGELVALIGANGAGKSTLLKTIVGLVPVMSGTVIFENRVLKDAAPERLVRQGVSLVPEGRLLFGSMTVRENLELGAFALGRRQKGSMDDALAQVHELFPVLAERATQPAETLSGGEQQMLAVGRALMSSPRLLLLDEPSLGLAPKVIGEIFSALDVLRQRGITVLLVEQDAKLALRHATRGYIMRTGSVVMQGDAAELLDNESVRKIYLGSWQGEGERSS